MHQAHNAAPRWRHTLLLVLLAASNACGTDSTPPTASTPVPSPSPAPTPAPTPTPTPTPPSPAPAPSAGVVSGRVTGVVRPSSCDSEWHHARPACRRHAHDSRGRDALVVQSRRRARPRELAGPAGSAYAGVLRMRVRIRCSREARRARWVPTAGSCAGAPALPCGDRGDQSTAGRPMVGVRRDRACGANAGPRLALRRAHRAAHWNRRCTGPRDANSCRDVAFCHAPGVPRAASPSSLNGAPMHTTTPTCLRLENRHTGEVIELVRKCDGGENVIELRGTLPPHEDGPPLHIHHFEDEDGMVTAGEITVEIRPGACDPEASPHADRPVDAAAAPGARDPRDRLARHSAWTLPGNSMAGLSGWVHRCSHHRWNRARAARAMMRLYTAPDTRRPRRRDARRHRSSAVVAHSPQGEEFRMR